MDDKQWAKRCMSLGSIPIDIKINKDTGKMYLECYKYKSSEFTTGLKEEMSKFRKLIHSGVPLVGKIKLENEDEN